ncbi:DUF4268 domain-containing protein [Algoriphagus sediminis]|uniref:DUF4268 domain-containing protein n=1 Tax=Algoriphagus sediminis TaxID=3057113 RepID=A0ABT7Y828_9BACT|nr:DUF4268 domain-containing protein [Algoriphagus sediminis]MDN3202662.1 DUF4268 domain-containing protein [Algoriphagus sediminis]
MYSRAEKSAIRKKFWTTFGLYMKPIKNAQGKRISWQNYKSRVKDIYFRMEAERGYASISIDISHSDLELQELYFDQFKALKKILENSTQESWEWALHTQNNNGQTLSRIYKRREGVNVMEEETWPEIISFLKPRIIALDEFWDNVKPGFEDF